MSNYTKLVDYAAKDLLLHGDAAKAIKGTEVGAEFDAIATMSATKVDSGGALGTPSSGTLTNCTGLPVSTGVSGLGTGVATALAINVGSAGAPVTNGGALGTPSSGTLTNCTGLPLAGVVDSTTEALGVGSIELGHATDTTITRTGAGAIAVEGVAVLLSGGALGTPSSGTLTNCTGLPLAGVVDSTTEALGVGSIELGHATDTTITRVSAGTIAVEGVNVLTTATGISVTQGTLTATTSGTSVDITGIPATAKRITINRSGMSTNGTSAQMLQIGDSGGIETSGYSGSVTDCGAGYSLMSTGYLLNVSSTAAFTWNGTIELTLHDATTNTWAISASSGRSDGAGLHAAAGVKSLTGTLDRFRFTTAGGVDTFDAGNFNYIVESW